MAATWEPKLTVTKRSQGRVSVSAIRTDGADVRTITVNAKFRQGKESKDAFKARLAAQLHDKYLSIVAGEVANAAFLDAAETDIKTALDLMEVQP